MTAVNTFQRDGIARANFPDALVLPLPSPLLAMMPPQLQGLPMKYFTEPIEILGVPPGQTRTGQFTTDNNHAHVAFVINCKVRSADDQTSRDDDPAAYAMTDTNNLQYQPPNMFLDIEALLGSGKQPAIQPVPLTTKQNSGVILTVINQDLVNTNNYRFYFCGVLVDVPPGLDF